jgi:hypothetical protein
MPWWGWVIISFAVSFLLLLAFSLAFVASKADELMGYKDYER